MRFILDSVLVKSSGVASIRCGFGCKAGLFASDFHHMKDQIGSNRVHAQVRTGVISPESRPGQVPCDGLPTTGIAALGVKSLAGGLNVERTGAAIQIGYAEFGGLRREAGGEAVLQHELHRLVARYQARPGSKTLVIRASVLHR